MVAEEYAESVEHCHAWSNSQIVLHWLRSSEPTNNSLIDSYVAHIQELLPSHVWRYVPTDSNPADVASRGTDLFMLQQMRAWWEGPSWLVGLLDLWPAENAKLPSSCNPVTDGALQSCCAVQCTTPNLLEKFSDLGHLLRFLARLRRWIRRRLRRDPAPSPFAPLTTIELRDAYLACVRLSQRQFFALEIASLQKGGRVPAKNPLLSLDPIFSNNVLRVGDRLQHSALTFDEQHPPILDSRCSLARLIIQCAHARALHGGVSVTSTYVARKAWIVGGWRRIKSILQGCVVCARLQARPATQHMAPLLASRVTPARAFSRTGVYYAGPFNILSAKGRGIRTSKGYVAIFVCMTTKASHLESVGDFSTESFIGALTRFCARRDREIREALQDAEIKWERVAGSLAEQGVTWHFIPPRAPHFGGLWEAGVKVMKHHLCRALGPHNLTYEEFSTVLASIEAVLNSRPLTPFTGGLDDQKILTPGHFLVGGPSNSVLEASTPPEKLDRLSNWKLVRGIRDQFWSRWSREYLNTLQQRPKWKVPHRNFQVDDVVAVVDATLLQSSGTWPLGRIISVHPGPDGLVRAATIQTATGEYTRPISKLSLLPVRSPSAGDATSKDPVAESDPGTVGGD
ncbi:uncharacterized protein LOC106644257 [Copidosoma floridanum]|uniref:uncharacterized protein LOC106644257 n=1 Tax=Copidosoma floridanum TaxID=29053 RepID=UPI0006C9A39F|nr:uncharacterized protein LOC106644257 [Copidosoma floridanum]